jgi:hypothetical protein
MRRIVVALAVALAPLAARAQVSLGLEATLSAPRLGVTRVPGSSEPLTAAGDVGGSALLRLGFLGLGVAVDRNAHGRGGAPRNERSAMGGLVTDLMPLVRLELLGELGYADGPTGLVRFRGVRPGLSAKLPELPLRLGVWGLARWGLPGAPTGPAYGLLFRAGVEF